VQGGAGATSRAGVWQCAVVVRRGRARRTGRSGGGGTNGEARQDWRAELWRWPVDVVGGAGGQSAL
jgi:hypothetical protein